jgi:2'-5' RNA ligase
MRLFVGVGVDRPLRLEAERLGSGLRARLGAHLRPSWVLPENLHLTVRFIGHVQDERVATLVERVAQPLDTPAFDVELSGCGSFPPRGAPRVIWVGVTRGSPQLAALHEEFDRRLGSLGYPLEDRPFSVHLTIARIKHAPPGSRRLLDEALAACDFEPLLQRVDRVTIFESRLSPQGPRYTALRELPLRTSVG